MKTPLISGFIAPELNQSETAAIVKVTKMLDTLSVLQPVEEAITEDASKANIHLKILLRLIGKEPSDAEETT